MPTDDVGRVCRRLGRVGVLLAAAERLARTAEEGSSGSEEGTAAVAVLRLAREELRRAHKAAARLGRPEGGAS
jgi:hypothetical protein